MAKEIGVVTGWKITKETSRVGGFSLNWPDKNLTKGRPSKHQG